ncbi:hypothetical protein ACFSJS_24850 [Streptomyces desertarenae]|uniref:Uncharacterized protein n=1 Tax=Streptomyces desertarenae TaxID=2666184 RepID=A0ABW4PRE0_9ACTN
MLDPELLERITTRRAEPDELEEQPAKQPAEARATPKGSSPGWNDRPGGRA